MIRILIADDHAVVRRGLRQILAGETDITVAGEASCATQVVEHLRSHPVDLLLLDMAMPSKHGLELLKELKAEFPRLAVLVLSMYPADQFGVRALRAGAAGYLTKDSEPEEMLKAVRKAASGRKYITAELAESLEMELRQGLDRPLHEHLSDREFEVFRLIASGKTVSQIADELMLSVKTVSNYRTRALSKANMKTNADVMSYGFKNGLVQ